MMIVKSAELGRWCTLRAFVVACLSALAGAQDARTVVTFDDGVEGSGMVALGDEPMYHYREQVVYGAPLVIDLAEVYPPAQSVVVHPASRWEGTDVVPMFSRSNKNLDIWFGDPFDGGVRTTYAIGENGYADLMNGDPIPGYGFSPSRLFVVGDRMIAYCSVYVESVDRVSRVGILSADMADLEAGSPAPWTVHFVTGEYSADADRCGGLWPVSEPLYYDGSYWSVVADYDSGLKAGGQCWLLRIDADGTPRGMVRLHTRSGQSGEHWHGGGIVLDDAGYKVVWHLGDSNPRLFFRRIPSLSGFDSLATVDTGSGVGGLYRTKVASDEDWGPVTVAGGPDEDTALVSSRWQNGFVLGQDPHDPREFLYGGDVSAGLINRVSIDSNGVAVSEPAFNPISRNVRQQQHEVSRQLSTFMLASMGPSLAGIVSNEFHFGMNVSQYSGVIHSDDGGTNWGWIWKGSTGVGLGQNSGIAVLSNGRVIVGTQDESASVLGITPGAKLSGRPLFVGFRPVNILGGASEQEVISSGAGGGGGVTLVGSSPERPLPPIVHTESVFDLARVEGYGGGAVIKLIADGIDQQVLAPDGGESNMNVGFWIRRKTPSSSGEADRMQVDTRFGWSTPGGNYGAGVERFTPPLKVSSNDWVRVIGQYDGHRLSGVFSPNPGDLRASIRGEGLATTSGNSEVLFEYANIGHDRPALPYNTFDAAGISSAKFTGLGLGDSWSVLVAMQIPEETWDSWSGDESDTWSHAVPVLSVSDAHDTAHATLSARLVSSARDGAGVRFSNAVFDWELSDSALSEPTRIADHPLRTTGLVVALSKDGGGDLQYAIAGPQGIASGSRPMSGSLAADTLRFSDIGESDALEMYIHQIQFDCGPYTSSELEAAVRSLELAGSGGGSCGCVADFNGDGDLNFFDISVFLGAYADGEPAADLNGDGSIDFFDISVFLGAYGAGCN